MFDGLSNGRDGVGCCLKTFHTPADPIIFRPNLAFPTGTMNSAKSVAQRPPCQRSWKLSRL
jgi:hypothetical protein